MIKAVLPVVAILSCSLFGLAQEIKNTQAVKEKMQSVTYTCSMHPEIHATKPGNCPKCGMKLVKEKTKAGLSTRDQLQKDTSILQRYKKPSIYTCPMHPEVHANKPGNCPNCGMALIKERQKADTAETNMPMYGDTTMKHQDDMDSAHLDNMPSTEKVDFRIIENTVAPKTVRYDLYINDTIVNYTGRPKRAIAVNGEIPMPTLVFTQGDTAEIYVHNRMDEETSLHWHGLFLPNQYDGVPNLTQMPIKPHSTHVYRFPVIQHGTHWYHSHTELQEQIGMYGSMILNKRKDIDIPTIPVILSEWTDMKPEEVHRSLHNATDWFAIKKRTTQSYSEAITAGYLKTKLANEWKRMNAMDVSDVAYDKFLINGMNINEQPQFKAGDKVRLRISNGGASTYFWLSYAGGKITVIATDGNDVEPVEVDRLLIAVSETYDIIVTIPENKSFELLVTPEDRTQSASMWLGSGQKVPAVKFPTLKYFAGMKMMNEMMAMNGDLLQMEDMKMSSQSMDMNSVMYPEITGEEKPKNKVETDTLKSHDSHTAQMAGDKSMPGMNMAPATSVDDDAGLITLNYTMLKAPLKTTLREGLLKELKFDLTGNMNRYVWSMDNKVVSEADKILIKKGENLRIVLYNNSMMRHPMHLHGHDFRLLNGQGEYAPMKNIIDIMPMERDTIEFAATERGNWFFHCHILYHMMSGMGRIFSYENSPANPEIPDPTLAQRKLFADDWMLHFMAKLGIEYNGSDGQAMLAQTRWKLSTMWHLGYHDMHGYESETMIGRYLGKMQWLYPYAGFDYHYKKEGGPKNIFGGEEKNWFGQSSNKNNRKTVVVGIAYTLPMLVIADARVDGNGKFRFQLSRDDIAAAPRLRFSWMINTDKEYMAGLRYIVTKYFSLSTHYDSDMGLGAGITIIY
jgi:CopA family copper-resistance protein